MKLTTVFTAVLLIAFLTLNGCGTFKEKLGITTEVTQPEEGTPEYVVFQVIKAAIKAKKDEKAGWQDFVKQLHPEERANLVQKKTWREFRFTALVRKVHLFTMAEDDAKSVSEAAFEIVRVQEVGNGNIVKVFVKNEGNPESPTPCKLEKTENGWGVIDTCLN